MLKQRKGVGLTVPPSLHLPARRRDRITLYFAAMHFVRFAQSRHFATEFQCLLLGVKQTFPQFTSKYAFDPKRTSLQCSTFAPIGRLTGAITSL